MYKYAEEVKQAEVRGCIAAWIDAGQIKVASEGAFEDLCSKVAANLSDDYDLQKVAAVTEAVLSGGIKKTASQETARNAALGELLLMKTAGQIDDATFVKTAQELMKIGGTSAREMADMYRAEGRQIPGRLARAEGLEEAMIEEGRKVKGYGTDAVGPRANKPKISLLDRAKKSGRNFVDFAGKHKMPLGIGAGALGAAGAAYLGKQLYDKYAQ